MGDPKPRKPRAAEIPWAKNPLWTHHLIAQLSDNDVLRRNLFSESTADAKADGRSKTKHAKSNKLTYYQELADSLFSSEDAELLVDETRVKDYENDAKRYAQSVCTHFAGLKKTYVDYASKLGKTGNGLRPEEAGSKIANIIDQIKSEWPFWESLHAMWREMPNYVPPCIVTSGDTDPGGAFERAVLGGDAKEDGEDGRGTGGEERDSEDEEDRIPWPATPSKAAGESQRTPQRSSTRLAIAESVKSSPLGFSSPSANTTGPRSTVKNETSKNSSATKRVRGTKRGLPDTFGERQKEEAKRLSALDTNMHQEKVLKIQYLTAKIKSQDKERQRRHEAAEKERQRNFELRKIQLQQMGGSWQASHPHASVGPSHVPGPSTLEFSDPFTHHASPTPSITSPSFEFDLGMTYSVGAPSSVGQGPSYAPI